MHYLFGGVEQAQAPIPIRIAIDKFFIMCNYYSYLEDYGEGNNRALVSEAEAGF